MNSLPLISHRLFAAAIGHAPGPETRRAKFEAELYEAEAPARDIPVELLDWLQTVPSVAGRPLQASVSGDGI